MFPLKIVILRNKTGLLEKYFLTKIWEQKLVKIKPY